MAIIAALRENEDSIFIATDSLQTESDGIDPPRGLINSRLQCHPKLPIAWATKDNFTIGRMFGQWFKEVDIATTDWYSVQQQIASQLSALNGDQRQLSRLAGIESKLEELCGVLVVGFLDGVGSIFEVDARGALTVKDDYEFHSIGSGWVHAKVAFEALRRVQSNISTEEKVRTAMSIVADMVPGCGPPVHLAQVTPSGIILCHKRPIPP